MDGEVEWAFIQSRRIVAAYTPDLTCTVEETAPEPLPLFRKLDMHKLSQETLAIIGATIALAALILTSTAGIRGEIQAVRVEIRDVRIEARADRETFQSHIIRLTEQQGILSGRVESIRNPLATIR